MAFWSNISVILFLAALILLILCIISFFKKNGKAIKYGRSTVICFIISFLVMITSTEKTDHPIINFFANVCLILFIFFLVLAILSIIKKTGMAKKQFLITAVLFIAFGVLTSISTPSAQKITANDKKIASEKADKKDAEKKKELEKKEANEKARKQQEKEEQKQQAEEQALKQQEEQKRQAEEQASQKKSTVASSATSNHGGSNGQPFQNDPSDDKETNPSCKGQIKGNANSKKYHVPGGQYYDSTKDNIVWFCSEVDAKAAGYVKSKK
ncbi:calcium-binding protein [Bacillus pseudomycoides]|uniref:Calcium-binding protein n=2 Tax=Bacillus pseudomycoides TaxID=64104 RepID=A0ABD6T5R5_9BACI|nr:calcium-binding protein [Bacillus pseudomycoides]PFW87667.1 calcium-binding protein [Bacillus pseudomycoides]PHE91057.1 calcium-binding protein [Bacillus pseudomycoides]